MTLNKRSFLILDTEGTFVDTFPGAGLDAGDLEGVSFLFSNILERVSTSKESGETHKSYI